MDTLLALTTRSFTQVWITLTHNWPFLLASAIVAVLLKNFLNKEKITSFLLRNNKIGVVGVTLAAVGTPLCSCGTTAVIIGMTASMLPWAPVVAFMVSSPLTSPGELIYSAGLFGWPLALAFFISSILLGLLGGGFAGYLESRGWLKNQARFRVSNNTCNLESPQQDSRCSSSTESTKVTDTTKKDNDNQNPRFNGKAYLREFVSIGGRLLLMFLGFAFVGYFLNGLIPSAWVVSLFGQGNVYSIPLAATLGLPFYVNTEASLPLVRSMLDAGMSQGAALAFMITGAGTSFGAIAGALTIARWRVIMLVAFTLWIGGVLSGYLFNWIGAAL